MLYGSHGREKRPLSAKSRDGRCPQTRVYTDPDRVAMIRRRRSGGKGTTQILCLACVLLRRKLTSTYLISAQIKRVAAGLSVRRLVCGVYCVKYPIKYWTIPQGAVVTQVRYWGIVILSFQHNFLGLCGQRAYHDEEGIRGLGQALVRALPIWQQFSAHCVKPLYRRVLDVYATHCIECLTRLSKVGVLMGPLQ